MGFFKRHRKAKRYLLNDEVDPLCPHCGSSIDGLASREVDHDSGRAYLWACPKCGKVLGVTHRSGYVAEALL